MKGKYLQLYNKILKIKFNYIDFLNLDHILCSDTCTGDFVYLNVNIKITLDTKNVYIQKNE